jgi:filamin
VAEGDGLKRVVAGETGKFKVTTKDANGNVLLVGGNKISANLAGPEKLTANVVDNNNGTYDASYVPKIVGNYTLDVKLDSNSIHGSPFKVEVVPAAPHAGNTEASGDGIKHGNTDTPAKFKIQTKDAFGNKCVTGGAPIDVSVRGPHHEIVHANVKDNKDGTYDVDYLPKGSGDFVVDVTLGGAHIKDAPFKVKIDPGKGGRPATMRVVWCRVVCVVL